jgi:hypothetical protein
LTDQEEVRRRSPLRPLHTLPPIVDATIVDSSCGIAVEISGLCERAGIPYRITGGFPPLVVLRQDGGHVRGKLREGRECFVIDVSGLPIEEPERSLRVLELLVRGVGCYEAQESLCAKGYFSPDIVETYSGRVIIEGDDQ